MRLPAEWEVSSAVIVAMPHAATDWAYMLDDVRMCYAELVRAIARHAKVIIVAPDVEEIKHYFSDVPDDRIYYFEAPTNDTWTRDYGVITTDDAEGNPVLNDFGFNAWGGKFESALDNKVTSLLVKAGWLRGKYVDRNDFILEGGSIESDGRGTIMTTSECLLTDTRNPEFVAKKSRKPYEDYLRDALGAKQVLWVDHGHLDGDDTDGHIDTIARLTPNDTILYCGAGPLDDGQARSLKAMREQLATFRTLDGRPFTLVEMPCPDPIYDEDGERIPATYANYLVVNDAVLLPVYGQLQNDFLAEQIIKVAFPDHEVETVDCRALIRQHGSLHCATMQIPLKATNL